MTTILDIALAALLDSVDSWLADLADQVRELGIWLHRRGSVLFGGE